MSFSDPIKYTDVDINKLELQFPKEGGAAKANGQFIYVKHQKQKLRVLCPTLTAPYGAGRQKENQSKFSMAVAFDGSDKDEDSLTPMEKKAVACHKVLTAISNRIKQLMMDNRELFFKDAKKDPKKKSNLSDELLAARYKDFMRQRDEQSDMMYLGIQTRKVSDKDKKDGKYTADEIADLEKRFVSLPNYPLLVDNEGNPVDITVDNISEVIPYGSQVRPVMELAYLWVTSEKVYPIWTFVHGLRVSTGPSKSFNILNEDDDEEEGDQMETEENNEENGEENDGDSNDTVEEEEEMSK